jgi:hypothetical protein
MFRYTILFIVACFLNPELSAQTRFRTEVDIGISGGLTGSRVVFYPAVDQQIMMAYTGGLAMRCITEPHLGLQLEVNYLKRGWLENLSETESYERTQEVLMVPLLTHIYFGKQRTRLQFVIGPYISCLLSDSEFNTVAGTNDYHDYYGKEIAQKVEFGFRGGISLGVRTKLGIFELQCTYNHGLTNLFKPGTEAFIYLGSRPQMVDLSLCYFFKITPR